MKALDGNAVGQVGFSGVRLGVVALGFVLAGGLVASSMTGKAWAAEEKKEPAKEAPAAPPAAQEAPAAKPAPPPPPPRVERAGPSIVEMDPFLVNLADAAETRFAKITIKLESAAAGFSQSVDEHLHQIRDSLLILISSKHYSNIRTVEGKLELRDNILERVNAIVGEGKVGAVYFTEFVVQ